MRQTIVVAAAALAWIVARDSAARAEPPRFIAEVERNQVPVGEVFVYQVTLSVGGDEVSDYRPPDFKGFRVLSRPTAPNQSTQMQFGGAGMFVQISFTWRYEIAAAQKGSLTIGAARARVGGQDFRSNVVVVSASGAAAAGSSAAARVDPTSPTSPTSPAQPGVGPAPGAAGPGELPPEASSGGSFIRVTTDKQKVFVGEAVSATWSLYMSQAADKYDTRVEPQTEGFWSEDIQVQSRRGGLVLSQEMVQGRNYQVGTVVKRALFPLRSGRLTITPMEAEISRSDFFGNAVRSQRVRSVPTVIEVMPLPKAGQPSGFEVANVGTFTLAARVDRAQVPVGEAVTVTIEVGGRGNLRKLVLPSVQKPDGWKAYEPRVNTVIDPASGVTGTKTAEVLLLPERPGTVTVPALVLDTFDPETQRYVRAETTPITLTATGDAVAVTAGVGGSGTAPRGPARAAENVLADEIRPLHTRAALRRDIGTTFFRTRGFLGVLLLPPFGFVLALVGFRLRDRWAEDTGPRRRRRVRQKVRAHLAAADAHRQRGDARALFIEVDRVLRETIASRMGTSVKALRMDELRALLTARGLPAAETDRVISLLEQCDGARFGASAPGVGAGAGAGAGAGGDGAALSAALDQANALIDVIEKIPLAEEGRT
ncbi:MAG: BatD family protein [Bacteroidota bacterium]